MRSNYVLQKQIHWIHLNPHPSDGNFQAPCWPFFRRWLAPSPDTDYRQLGSTRILENLFSSSLVVKCSWTQKFKKNNRIQQWDMTFGDYPRQAEKIGTPSSFRFLDCEDASEKRPMNTFKFDRQDESNLPTFANQMAWSFPFVLIALEKIRGTSMSYNFHTRSYEHLCHLCYV